MAYQDGAMDKYDLLEQIGEVFGAPLPDALEITGNVADVPTLAVPAVIMFVVFPAEVVAEELLSSVSPSTGVKLRPNAAAGSERSDISCLLLLSFCRGSTAAVPVVVDAAALDVAVLVAISAAAAVASVVTSSAREEVRFSVEHCRVSRARRACGLVDHADPGLHERRVYVAVCVVAGREVSLTFREGAS